MSYKNKQWLYEYYIIKQKSLREIADICNLKCHQTLMYWLKKFNIPARQNWSKNLIHLGANGYLIISVSGKKGGMLYHRYLMEKHLGRSLKRHEVVHHKDGNKLNNDISNLEIVSHIIHNHIHPSHIWPHKKTCHCAICKRVNKKGKAHI